jgi:hypothetical protein
METSFSKRPGTPFDSDHQGRKNKLYEILSEEETFNLLELEAIESIPREWTIRELDQAIYDLEEEGLVQINYSTLMVSCI